MERASKLPLAWHMGRRTPLDTALFADSLRLTTNGRFQLTTDDYGPYEFVVPRMFGDQIDFAQLVKVYGTSHIERHNLSDPHGRPG